MIIADYHLEHGDTGVAAIEALRSRLNQPVPAIMVTAHRDPDIARTCAAMGVHLMEKPLRPSELGETLARVLG